MTQIVSPRCILYGMAMFLSADKRLKPCCFLNPYHEWKLFVKWGEENKLDVANDLDLTKHTKEEVMKSDTWLKLIDSFDKPNASPATCYRECGSKSWESTNMVQKYSDFGKVNNDPQSFGKKD
jgi:hypothetical protein